MRKGILKNRHCSKRKRRREVQKAHEGSCINRYLRKTNKRWFCAPLMADKWRKIEVIILALNFSIDKLPRVINWLMNLLGMGL